MSLRLKLLLLSLTTLILPWAGCQYAREMETALRSAEKQSLTEVARAMADSLQGRGDLLYRSERSDTRPPGPADIEPITLGGAPSLDGYRDEWPEASATTRTFEHAGDRLSLLAGVYERMLYLLLDVRDRRVVFDPPGAGALDADKSGDRVWIVFQDSQRAERRVFIAATGAGAVQARHIEAGELGEPMIMDEPRISGAWQLKTDGYRVELRVPLSMLGERMGVLIDDRDTRGGTVESYGSLPATDPLRAVGRLIAASPELEGYLGQMAQPGLQLAALTPGGALLASASAPASTAPLPGPGLLERLYRSVLAGSGAQRLIEASAPIYSGTAPRSLLGQLRVSRSTDRWLTLRDHALMTLMNFTLIATLVAVIATAAFSAHLGLRLARLRRASESALTRTGLVTAFPETASRDELGDVARSFSTLLGRLDEYTGYLRTLAGKLAHEIRTPLTIVRSSLENLETEGSLNGTVKTYLDRAREGSERLNTILHAMGAATRVEEAINSAERTRFDLTPVVASAVNAYRDTFAHRKFALDAPSTPLGIDGAPELIVQLLDKLIDNAIDFTPDGGTITVRLSADADNARLEVENPGPPLAPGTRGRIFESLWQSRVDADSRPHFGLGLYIVRLIAEFHHGSASAENLPDDSGVRFIVKLARTQ
jgi:two-component system, OmpR family, sensor histidine kinase ChvG